MRSLTFSIGLAVSALVAGCAGDAYDLDDEHGGEEPHESIRASAAAIDLINGVPVTGLAGTRGQELHYALVVPAGATGLGFALSGGTGDADLYVRFGAAPTRSQWDYRPYRDGNDETVTPSPIRAGTYFVMVRGYAAFTGVALVASFSFTPPGGGELDCRNAATWPAEWVAFEDQVLVLVNQHRAAGATCGGSAKPPVGPLVEDAALREASRCHSLDMAVRAFFDHTNPDGASPWDRIAAAGYTGSARGENIAAGYATPQQVVDGWMSSSGHCGNIMAAGSNEIGNGFALKQGSPFGRYWTQTFGHR